MPAEVESSICAALANSLSNDTSHGGVSTFGPLFNWEKGWFVFRLHVRGEVLSSGVICSIGSLVSRHGAFGTTHVTVSGKTGVVGGGNGSDEKPPGTHRPGVVRPRGVFPGPSWEMDCCEDILERFHGCVGLGVG